MSSRSITSDSFVNLESGRKHLGNHVFPASSIKFDVNTYLRWSQSMLLAIAFGDCPEYLTGEKTKPKVVGMAASRWTIEDSLVKAYLINHMGPGTAKGYLFMKTAAEIWKSVKEIFRGWK